MFLQLANLSNPAPYCDIPEVRNRKVTEGGLGQPDAAKELLNDLVRPHFTVDLDTLYL